MKPNSTALLGLAILAGIALVTPAFGVVSIDYAYVGDIGNAADTTGFGSVGYAYNIAKNETTVSQYADFLNAAAKTDPYGLYNSVMGDYTPTAGITRSGISGSYTYSVVTGSGNKPITSISWFMAARFCNWMQNGQGSGSTETGAYALNGATSGIITKSVGATVWIPSENEWYKAAYYDPSKGTSGGYWLYPTQSDTMAGNTIGIAQSANYFDGDYVGSGTRFSPSSNALTDAGAYGANSASHYGTNDQGGNAWEWNDAVSGTNRGVRGGAWTQAYAPGGLVSSDRHTISPSFSGDPSFGFRIASVPEPSCMGLTLLAIGGVLLGRRRRPAREIHPNKPHR